VLRHKPVYYTKMVQKMLVLRQKKLLHAVFSACSYELIEENFFLRVIQTDHRILGRVKVQPVSLTLICV